VPSAHCARTGWLRPRGRARSRLGLQTSTAAAIAPHGAVAGWSTLGSRDHAFVWRHGRDAAAGARRLERGSRDRLGTLGGGNTYAVALDARGDVVGTSTTKSGASLPFVWRDGRMLALPTLRASGQPRAGATALDGHGHVVGYSGVAVRASYVEVGTRSRAHAVLWTLAG
jgi:probable HAF family extracellular repeat protein